MSAHKRGGDGGTRAAAVCFAAMFGLLAAVTIPLLASSAPTAASADTTTSCPNAGYSSATIADCTTTTSSGMGRQGAAHLVLHAHYSHRILDWRACVAPSSGFGSTVQLYLDGQQQNEAGGTGTIGSDGCTADTQIPLCLAKGTYTVTAVDQTVGSDTKSMTVGQSQACGTGATSGASHGALAFTGTNILRLVLIAAILLIVGYVVVRLNRQRRQHH